MGPAKRGATQQVYWRIDVDALQLVERMEAAPHRRGQFVSELIRQEAARRGLVAPPADDLATLRQELAALTRRIDAVDPGQGPSARRTVDTDPDIP